MFCHLMRVTKIFPFDVIEYFLVSVNIFANYFWNTKFSCCEETRSNLASLLYILISNLLCGSTFIWK
eukprot:UN24815